MNLVQVSDQELMEVDGGFGVATFAALGKGALKAVGAVTAVNGAVEIVTGRSVAREVVVAVRSARERGQNSTETGMSRRRARRIGR